MGFFLFLVFVAVACYFIFKPRNNGSSSYQGQPRPAQQPAPRPASGGARYGSADYLIASPYYSKYKFAFDYIRCYPQPKYKIDWLLYSLNMGRELEDGGYYVIESIKNNLPYFCETEYEFGKFFRSEHPLALGDVDGMVDMCLFLYDSAIEAYSHPAKFSYWRNRIRELASAGNYEAQAELFKLSKKLSHSDDEAAEFEKYGSKLLSLAESGDAHAQLAVGKHISPFRSQESVDWLTKAADQGLSDAWYGLADVHEFHISFKSVEDWEQGRIAQLPESEKHALEEKAASCYYNGAKADNGVFAGLCQYKVAGYYKDGDYWFPKDISMAKYWYQMALKNGMTLAKSDLKNINEHPDWYQ